MSSGSPDRVERRLAAILAADVAGYSRLMGQDEAGTLARMRELRRELIDPTVAEHKGRVVKTTGDGILIDFPSVVEAVACAVTVQKAMSERNKGIAADQRIEFRVGIHQGDIIVEDGDIFGDGVNLAARLEGLAEPGGICVSGRVRSDTAGKVGVVFDDLGEQSLKNIARPVHAYALFPKTIAALPDLGFPTTPPATRLGSPVRPKAPRLSIVVLPFANIGGDPDQEYFADGVTEDLTTDLSRIADSFVIARNTAFTYKGKALDEKQIGRELGVRYVLEGSVRRTGEQIRVNVQLIDVETGAHVWADRFDTDCANLVTAQDEITLRLAQTLDIELVQQAARRIENEGTVHPDARDFIMRGFAAFYRARTSTTSQHAQRAFERALEIEPGSIDARIGVAIVVARSLIEGWSNCPDQDGARVEKLLLEALEADPNRSAAHYAMGLLRRLQNRLMEARIEYETAIALDRNAYRVYCQLGIVLMYLGEPAAAIPLAEKAIRLNPRDPNLGSEYWLLGSCHLLLGHTDQAIDLLKRARAVNPHIWYFHAALAGALGLAGEDDEAKASLAESIKLKPEINSLAQWRAYAPWSNHPKYWAIREKTLNVGLRRVGFPDE